MTTATFSEQEVLHPTPGTHWHHVPVMNELPVGAPEDGLAAALRCRECGLRLLGLVLSSAAWVHRRVESVSFRDHRTVRRRVSVDFSVPEVAPFLTINRTDYRLVPITIMRRKSLINFDLRDEADRSVPLLGLRQNQAITLSLAEACACAVLEIAQPTDELTQFLNEIVSGTQEKMLRAYNEAKGPDAPRMVADLVGDPRFERLLDRLTEDFVLFALVPNDEPARRVLKFRYDEPLSRQYRAAKSGDNDYRGNPGAVPWWSPQPLLAALGWRPTRIRFPTPAAENARSYHFEAHAPDGIEIVSAQILAGRPDGREPSENKLSVDVVTGRLSTVDLHVVDVERGSLSRAQVDLRVALDSWLILAVASAWLTVGAVAWAANRLGRLAGPDSALFDGAAASALFITFAAAMAVIVWRPPEHRMAMRLMSVVGLVPYTSSLILLVAAALFVFESGPHLRVLMLLLEVPAVLVAAILTATAVRTASQACRIRVLSPWEQGRFVDEMEGARHEHTERCKTFASAAEYLNFCTPAIKVASAESDSAAPISLDNPIADEMRAMISHRLATATTSGQRPSTGS
jgi:hypothetical protein